MDLALAVLIGGTAAYAGGVGAVKAGRARALAVGAAVAAAVAAGFVLMVVIANAGVDLWAYVPVPFLVGAATFLVLRDDVGSRRAWGAAAGLGLLIGAATLYVSYLAPMAFVGAAGVYVVLRRWLPVRVSLLVMAAALGSLLLLAAAAFGLALASM